MNRAALATDLEQVTARINAYRARTKTGQQRNVTTVAKTTKVRDLLTRMPTIPITEGLRLAAQMDRRALSLEEAKTLRVIGDNVDLTPATVATTIIYLQGDIPA